MLTAIIMASGFSRRYSGENKLLKKLGVKTIFEMVLDSVLSYPFSKRIVLVPDDELGCYSGKYKGIDFVYNQLRYEGQSSSIKLGVNRAYEGSSFMFFTADQPFINTSLIDLLCLEHRKNKNKIIIPTYKGVRYSPCIFSHIYKKELLALTGDVGGKNIIKQNSLSVVEIEIENEYFFIDIDTPSDYKKAKIYFDIHFKTDAL